MITLDDYFREPNKPGNRDRRQDYPVDYDACFPHGVGYPTDLLRKVNELLKRHNITGVKVSSGWRPPSVNAKVGGAKKSLHMDGRAVDLSDKDGTIDTAIRGRPDWLKELGLWLEHPDSTPGWSHLDIGMRADRPSRMFKP